MPSGRVLTFPFRAAPENPTLDEITEVGTMLHGFGTVAAEPLDTAPAASTAARTPPKAKRPRVLRDGTMNDNLLWTSTTTTFSRSRRSYATAGPRQPRKRPVATAA